MCCTTLLIWYRLYCIVLYCIVMYCIVLHSIHLHCIVQYSTLQYSTLQKAIRSYRCLWTAFKATKFGTQHPPAPGSASHPLFGMEFPASPPPPPVGLNDLPQSVARQLLPPHTSIWRENKRGGWASHYTCERFPHKRHSEKWSNHGGDSHAAMLACVRYSWTLYLEDHRLPRSHCPITGLL